MIFSKQNSGKWVASKNGKVIDSSKKLETLLKRVEKRADRSSLWFDRVPNRLNFAGGVYGI